MKHEELLLKLTLEEYGRHGISHALRYHLFFFLTVHMGSAGRRDQGIIWV